MGSGFSFGEVKMFWHQVRDGSCATLNILNATKLFIFMLCEPHLIKDKYN